MRTLRTVLLALTLASAAGCATAGGTTPTAPRSSTVITQAELDASDAPNLRTAIERLRPNFLRSRGQVSISDPTAGDLAVYVDDVRLGGIEVLEQMLLTDVAEVRKLNAGEATQRWGTGHAGGAILIKRRTTVR